MYPLHLPGNRVINTERAGTVQRLTDVMACIWLRGAQQRTSRTNNRHRVGLQNGSGLQSAAAAHRYRRAASERTRRDRSTGASSCYKPPSIPTCPYDWTDGTWTRPGISPVERSSSGSVRPGCSYRVTLRYAIHHPHLSK